MSIIEKLLKLINKLSQLSEKHIFVFRCISFVLFILMIFVSILVPLNMMPGWLFVLIDILYTLVYMIMFIDTFEKIPTNFFDRSMFSGMILLSLLAAAGALMELVQIVFGNITISIYFGIMSFFVFSYLYEIHFREASKYDSTNILSLVVNLCFKKSNLVYAQTAAKIGFTCNIIRVILLIVTALDNQLGFLSEDIKALPIMEAIVTSLAFEKLIKSKYNKLGTKILMSEVKD